MKKILIFYNFKGPAELEWLMPILFNLKKKYKIFTIFRNKNAYEYLKKNGRAFYEWRKISSGLYIEKNADNFIFKCLFFVFKNFLKSKYFFNLMGEKIYNTKTLSKIIKKKTNLKNFEIRLFFSEFGHSSGWVDFLKKEGLVKTVHYPSNAQIYLGKKKFKHSLRGDIIFLNSYLDRKTFSLITKKKNIIISGNPKYDPTWIKKFYKKENTRNKIVIAYISRFDAVDTSYRKKLENQLIDLIKILNKLKKEIIFKIHPTKNSIHYRVILKKYAKFKWKESKKNLIELSQNCLCCVTHPYSSAGFDAIMSSRPVLQLWPINIDSEAEKRKLINQNLFIKEVPSYEKLNLITTTKSLNDFNKKIKLIVDKKNDFSNTKIKRYYPPKNKTIQRILDHLEILQKY